MSRTTAARTFVCLFFAALLALGLCTCAQYGQPWDEPWEMDILRMNLNQYAAAVGSDARLALVSSVEKPESGMIADSVERDHGESAYYPAAWLVTENGLTAAQRMALWHGYTWFLFWLGALALYGASRQLGLSRLPACLMALCLVLTPRFFAEGHYNNKDVVLLSLVLCTVWAALRMADRPTVRRALLFALCGALAANTKLVGLAVWGLCGLIALGVCLARGRRAEGPPLGRAVLAAVVGFSALYALLTPALWRDPSGYLAYLWQNATQFSRWDHYVLFRGQLYWLKQQPLPRSYLPWMIGATTPLWALALIALGQASALVRMARKPRGLLRDPVSAALLLCTLLWALPLGFAVVTRARAYNGWRHYYFLYGPMLVLAAYGLGVLARGLKAKRPARKALSAVCCAALALSGAVTTFETAQAHPRQYAYFNELARPAARAGAYEVDYWNVSALETLRAVSERASGPVTVCGAEQWSQEGVEAAYPLLPQALRERVTVVPEGGEYVLSNVTYALLSGWQPPESALPEASTQAYGMDLWRVYRATVQAKEDQP